VTAVMVWVVGHRLWFVVVVAVCVLVALWGRGRHRR
jgi:hypothetical protein